jgi:tight adherence protein C
MLGVPIYVVGAAALVVASLPLLAWSFGGVHQSRAAQRAANADGRAAHLQTLPLDRVLVPVAKAMGRRVRAVTPAAWVTSLDRRIRLAGSPPAWSLERVLALKVAVGVAAGLAVFVLSGSDPTVKMLAVTVGIGWAGYVMPDAILHGRGRERQKLILKELPDTLDQLTISVEAGLGFDAALARVAASGNGPLAEELTRVLSEVKVGVPRSDALHRLLDRTDVHELRHFVLALAQAEQYGLPIARVLRIQSGELRVKRRQRAEEEAMKIPVKIVFPLILCIFPALFVVLLGPAMIRVARVLL